MRFRRLRMRRIRKIGRIVLITLLLVFSSSVFETGEARYKTTSTGSFTLRVAKYFVSVGEFVLLSPDDTIDCNQENDFVQYGFTLFNDSEIPIAYQLTAQCPDSNVEIRFSKETGTLSEQGGEVDIEMTVSLSDRSIPEEDLAGITITVDTFQEEKI